MARGGFRPGAGRKPSAATLAKRALLAGAPGVPADTTAKPTTVELSALTPLDYLLSVVRDQEADPIRRMQAASIAAPYVHGRIVPAGKKSAKLEAAKEVAGGTGGSRFKPAAPPKLVAAAGKKV